MGHSCSYIYLEYFLSSFLEGPNAIWCRFPFFGKKYQLKFANEAAFDNHCLIHFPTLMRLFFLVYFQHIALYNSFNMTGCIETG
jgi:hypothetical protein